LFRGARLSNLGVEVLRVSAGRVVAFQSFTSFSWVLDNARRFPYGDIDPNTEQRVMYQLDCLGRPRIGGFAATEVRDEEETLLPPFAPMLLESVSQRDGRPLICLRDIALVEVRVPASVPEVRFQFEFEGRRVSFLLPAGSKIADACVLLRKMLECRDVVVTKGRLRAPPNMLIDPSAVYGVVVA
jgi:hypothetical protein